jgi:hypothetical protein
MFKLTKGSISTIICTLTEKVTISEANYLFVFTSRATNDVVKFVVLNTADVSTNQQRWNEFNITVNTYFQNKAVGWWTYQIYEQASTTNTNVSLAGALIEKGLMLLTDSTGTTFTQYTQNINFTMYDAG